MVPVAALAETALLARFASRDRRPRGARGRHGRRQPLRPGRVGAQRGDLGAPLIALGARVRSTGKGGERTEPVEDFLAGDRAAGSCSRSSTTAPAGRGRRRRMRRRHAHSYAIANVAVCSTDGEPPRRRLRGRPDGRALPRRRAEPQRRGRPEGRRARSTTPSPPPSTAARCCPCSSVAHSTNWRPHEADRQRDRAGDLEPAAHRAAARPARGARDHEPEGRLPAGRLRHVHRPRRRRAAPLVPDGGRDGRRRDDHDARGARRGRERSRRCRPRSTTSTPRSAASARPGWSSPRPR